MSHGFTSDKFVRGLQKARVPAAPIGYETNLTAAARNGVVVAGNAVTSNAVGAFVEAIASTANDARGVWVHCWRNDAGNTLNMLLSVAVGGVGAESIIIPDIDMGGVAQVGTLVGGRAYHFPGVFIPSGSRVSFQVRSLNANRSFVCAIALDRMLTYDVSQTTAIAYGSNQSVSSGTSVTPGNGAFGSWVEIGTTSRAHSIWTAGYDALADLTGTSTALLIELAFGPNSGSLTSLGTLMFYQSSDELVMPAFPPVLYSNEVPTSTKVWARIASGETEARGVIIYGV